MWNVTKTIDGSAFGIDTGAPSSVIGLKEVRRILQHQRLRAVPTRKSLNRFRFADSTFQSLGQVELTLSTPKNRLPIYVTLDIVVVDVPPLIGLYVLEPNLQLRTQCRTS